MKTMVHAIRVVPSFVADGEKINILFRQTKEFFRRLDSSFPDCVLGDEDYTIHHECFGGEYGLFTGKPQPPRRFSGKKSESI